MSHVTNVHRRAENVERGGQQESNEARCPLMNARRTAKNVIDDEQRFVVVAVFVDEIDRLLQQLSRVRVEQLIARAIPLEVEEHFDGVQQLLARAIAGEDVGHVEIDLHLVPERLILERDVLLVDDRSELPERVVDFLGQVAIEIGLLVENRTFEIDVVTAVRARLDLLARERPNMRQQGGDFSLENVVLVRQLIDFRANLVERREKKVEFVVVVIGVALVRVVFGNGRSIPWIGRDEALVFAEEMLVGDVDKRQIGLTQFVLEQGWIEVFDGVGIDCCFVALKV